MGTASEYTLRQLLAQLNGRGVWDTDGITQVLITFRAQSAAATEYTVPAGKTLYITSVYLTGRNTDVAVQTVWLILFDETDTEQQIWSMVLPQNQVNTICLSYPVPIKAGAGWYFVSDTTDTDAEGYGNITGYLI